MRNLLNNYTTIGFDLDDTLTQTTELLIKYANTKLNYSLNIEDLKVISAKFEDNGEMHIDEANINKIFKMFEEDRVFKDINSHEGSVKFIQNLLKNHKDIHIITTRYNYPRKLLKEDTLFWLERNKLEKVKLHFVENDAEKSSLAKNLGIQVFFEDRIKSLELLLEKNIKVYLFDRPWNRNLLYPNRFINWKDIQLP